MLTVLYLAVVFGFVSAPQAADSPSIQGSMPSVALAQATSKDGTITLTVKYPLTVEKNVAETNQIEVVTMVDGKEVKVLVPETKTKTVLVTQWCVTEVGLGDPGVLVSDAMGKAVTPDVVLKRLEEETAILRAVGGPVDPYYLQTTKPETLVLVTPLPPSPLDTAVPVDKMSATPILPAPRPLQPQPAEPLEEFEPSATEQEVIDLTNAQRKIAGAPSLTISPLLIQAARQHSANMAKQGVLDHTLDNKDLAERLDDVGYAWHRCGENIACGQRTPAEVVNSWMNSPSHRDNLLSTDNTQIGVAVAVGTDGRRYWTMVLALAQ